MREFNQIKNWIEYERYFSLSKMSNYDIFNGYLLAKYEDKKINKKEYKELEDINSNLFLNI